MAKSSGSAGGTISQGMGAGSMLKGLRNKNPSSSDKSTQLKMHPSVDNIDGPGSSATRGSTAASTPETLGPRTA